MKRFLTIIAILMTTLTSFADSYDELWKQVEQAESSDLPRTQIEILDKISKKAISEKAYGQLLAAEMTRAAIQSRISGDSLQPAVDAMIAKTERTEKHDPVLAAVYYASLCRLIANGHQLDNEYRERINEFRTKALTRPELLAAQKATQYTPLVTKGDDSRIFGDDLLHVIGMETDNFTLLHDYYERTGNRAAACLCALELYNRSDRQDETAPLDSLINLYGDLPEGGAVAVRKYQVQEKQDNVTAKQLIDYIDMATSRWSSWSGIDELRNKRMALTAPSFTATLDKEVLLPNKQYVVRLLNVRHIESVTMHIHSLTLEGDNSLSPTIDKELEKIRKAIKEHNIQTTTRYYSGKAEYELTDDSIVINPLPVGSYLIEFSAKGQQKEITPILIFVSNLQLLSEGQPGNMMRLAVVNATTGQPVEGAKIRLYTERYYGKSDLTETVTTGTNGETTYTYKDHAPYRAFVYTSNDKTCPISKIWNSFLYYENTKTRNTIRVFTDRRIYRPGQTVHAAAVLYQVSKGIDASVKPDTKLTFFLRDANYKKIATKEVTTDAYGAANADFELPQGGLMGDYTVVARGASTSGTASIQVDEYKRPTFQIEIPEYKEKYVNGDTVVVKGFAKTYAGVPVQGAKVSYRVTRRQAIWWWYYHTDEGDEQMLTDETTTADDGSFEMRLPMMLPKSGAATGDFWRPRFYQFVAEATVTDQGGESHDGSISLPLGTRTTALTCDLPEKAVVDSLHTMKFNRLNAAGQEIDGTVSYAFDGAKSLTTKAGQPVKVSLKPGRHQLVAFCEGDTVKQEIIVFSMDDKRPVIETHDWFYQSAQTFPRNGKPVYVQVGSSDTDQHILYSVMSGNKVLESGVIKQSNALTTRCMTWQEKYGSGIVMTFAWVKDGIVYTHHAHIERPLPDKRLKVEWRTFRDRLTPGQQETWTMAIAKPDGKPAEAHLIATLYDQSLDQLLPHRWSLNANLSQSLPYILWHGLEYGSASTNLYAYYESIPVHSLDYSHFDDRFFPSIFVAYGRSRNRLFKSRATADEGVLMAPQIEAVMVAEEPIIVGYGSVKEEKRGIVGSAIKESNDEDSYDENNDKQGDSPQLRENLAETAFFHPDLVSDKDGNITIAFTLPESITTWRFMGVAHDQEMNTGFLEGLSVAQKTVMIQPNVPRFIREGDEATLSARLFNTSEEPIKGTARLELVDPETDQIVFSDKLSYEIAPNGTAAVTFCIKDLSAQQSPLLIVRTMAVGDGYSDGEQHYLPILPNREQVLNTYPFTQHEPGVKSIDLTQLFPDNITNQRLTVEYTNNPSWLILQALPFVANADDENAISLAAAFYANSLSHEILNRSPRIRQTIEQWRMERPTVENGGETSLMSNLQKDASLKELLLNETPWVMDAEHESDQKQQLVRFFDENTLKSNLDKTAAKLKKLQNPDGSWSWWPGMRGNLYMTVAVSEMIVRLEAMLGNETSISNLLTPAYRYMEKEIHEEVLLMQREEKRTGKTLRPSETAVSYLYVSSFHADRKITHSADIDYLIDRLSKQTSALTIYGKARTAVVLSRYNKLEKAKIHLQSIKEYTVYKEEMGRYFDTFKAAYSWFDYRIPSQVAAIEALTTLTPDDHQTIEEMQRWLLQAKRTQAWDTPINSVNAVYAFLSNGNRAPWELGNASPTVLKVNGGMIETPQPTAGIGYVKVVEQASSNSKKSPFRSFSAEKTSEGTSWGAVYAQFMQPSTDIATASSGLTVKREIIVNGRQDIQTTKDAKTSKSSKASKSDTHALKVGDKVTVRITITADRDYDFVQVIDKRAACLEPVGQLSGYHWGYYCTPKDYTTNYYFDRLSKGKHVVETEYYIDRAGNYNTGTCIAQCAYAPEYTGRDKAMKLNIGK